MLQQYITHANSTIQNIFEATLDILITNGAQDLSMRKIAGQADMSLSNVQYYFKTKDILLGNLLETFLQNYTVEITETLPAAMDEGHLPDVLQSMIQHIIDRSDMVNCLKVFKEIWLLAEYQPEVNEALQQYYKDMTSELNKWLTHLPVSTLTAEQIDNIISLLIPYFEGYYITQNVLPNNKEKTVKLLTHAVLNILNIP